MTGMPALTMALTREQTSLPPSSLMPSQAAWAMKRPALSTADSSEAW